MHLLDVAGELLHWGGQLLVSYVLVGLAYGWTLSSRAVQNFIPNDKVRPLWFDSFSTFGLRTVFGSWQ